MLLTILAILFALWFVGVVFHLTVGPIYMLLLVGLAVGMTELLSGPRMSRLNSRRY